ncbi:hypothetical protein O6H91_16G049900 [Diphasiastrum complanatum]|nr:hypothetical protein O6H91_16G049900 [Diphasiastrum complanatum]
MVGAASIADAALDLRSFLLRSRVLSLYRSALRTACRAPDNAQGELKRMVREEMERNRPMKDPQSIRYLLSEGLQRLKELNTMLENQGNK